MGICLLVWCLGQGVASAERVTFTHDMRDHSRSERIFGSRANKRRLIDVCIDT